jgi:hypothetical protein
MKEEKKDGEGRQKGKKMKRGRRKRDYGNESRNTLKGETASRPSLLPSILPSLLPFLPSCSPSLI